MWVLFLSSGTPRNANDFRQLSGELWPVEEETKDTGVDSDAEDNVGEEEVDIEKAIAQEVQKIKRPRKETRFCMCVTMTSE